MQTNFNPSMPPQMQAQMGATAPKPSPQDDGGDIIQELEAHLDSIDDRQKEFLLNAVQTQPDAVINALGIVNGPEVYMYFKDLYMQLNSAQQGQPTGTPEQAVQNQGQQAPSFNPQAKATPSTQNFGM